MKLKNRSLSKNSGKKIKTETTSRSKSLKCNKHSEKSQKFFLKKQNIITGGNKTLIEKKKHKLAGKEAKFQSIPTIGIKNQKNQKELPKKTDPNNVFPYFESKIIVFL